MGGGGVLGSEIRQIGGGGGGGCMSYKVENPWDRAMDL